MNLVKMLKLKEFKKELRKYNLLNVNMSLLIDLFFIDKINNEELNSELKLYLINSSKNLIYFIALFLEYTLFIKI